MLKKILFIFALTVMFAVGSICLAVNGNGQGQERAQNQNQTQNEGEEAQIRTEEQERAATSTGQQIAEQRRSNVANAVQEMLKVADRNGGIGAQVREIGQEQTKKHENLEASLKKVQGRNRLIKFLIGPDYNEVKMTEQQMTQVEEQVRQLRELKSSIKIKNDQQKLETQLQQLEQVQTQLKIILEESKGGFSLLGWAFKMFSR